MVSSDLQDSLLFILASTLFNILQTECWFECTCIKQNTMYQLVYSFQTLGNVAKLWIITRGIGVYCL